MTSYFMPTKIISGKDCIKANAALFKSFGRKALIVTGTHSAKLNGSEADIISVLKENGQEWCIYDKVTANPTVDCCYNGAEFSKSENVDFIVAIGGGSPMDAAKAIALLSKQDIPKENLFSGGYSDDVLPMIFVPTTAGTGSEVTPYSILTNDKLKTKTSIASPHFFPKIAFLDAAYTKSLSPKTAVNTAIDAFSHAAEGILSVRAGFVSDAVAAESLRRVSSCFDSLCSGTLSDEERETLLEASALAGMVIANTGTTAVHAMGYPLTYFRNIDHGRANGLVLGEFLKLIEKSAPEKIAVILNACKMKSTDELCHKLSDLLGEKEKLSEKEIEEFSEISSKAKNIYNCIVIIDKNDITELFKKSFN